MNTHEEDLLNEATKPINSILGNLKPTLTSNTEYIGSALLGIFLIFYLFFTSEEIEHNRLFDFYLIILFVFFISYFLKRSRKLRKLYFGLENRALDSKETLIKTYYELKYLVEKVYPLEEFIVFFIFNSFITFNKDYTKLFLENLFDFKNPFEGVPLWFPPLFVLIPILLVLLVKRRISERHKEDYLDHLENLQNIINKF